MNDLVTQPTRPLASPGRRPIPLPTSARQARPYRLALPPANPEDGALYVRISYDKEGAGLGVARQEEDCRRLAEQRGYRVVRVFSDNDTSAFQRHVVREDYERMMDGLRAGHFSTVIVWHLDRLWRKPRELEDMIELCEGGERQVVSCYGDYDLSTTDGCFMARLVVAQANKESADKSRRMKRKQLELAQAGKPKGAPRHFGYDKSGMVIVEEEAALIREAAERIDSGGESVRSVCRDFQRRGVTGGRNGGPITRNTLRGILTSARVCGQRAHNGQVVAEAVWPAILTPEQVARLRALFHGRGRSYSGRRHLLSGFLRCGRCGGRMAGVAKSNGKRYYLCPPNMTSFGHGCGRLSRSMDGIDSLVTEAVFAVFDSPQVRQALDGGMAGEAETLMAEIQEDQALLAELRSMYLSRQIKAADWLEGRSVIERRIENKSTEFARVTEVRRVETAAAGYVGRGGALREDWPDLSLEQRRAIIASVLDHVVVEPCGPGRTAFDPTKIKPVWKVHSANQPGTLPQAA